MKGIVFTEFLDLVESKFGLEMVDKIITTSNLKSGGSYTAIGTYEFSEMLQLISSLSSNTEISVDDLLLTYGEHFFSVLESSYPEMLAAYRGSIELLSSIENHIHVEVRKIYPDAELPTFEILSKSDQSLEMIYRSSRAMHMFGLGLMRSSFKHFNQKSEIQYEKIEEDGTVVKFKIQLLSE